MIADLTQLRSGLVGGSPSEVMCMLGSNDGFECVVCVRLVGGREWQVLVRERRYQAEEINARRARIVCGLLDLLVF